MQEQARGAFKVCIVRHGERADHVFGPKWTAQFFESDGSYVRADLNMPLAEDMPRRPLEDWAIDPPITELGRWQARQVGAALGGIAEFHAIVCSPALRCLQTAEEIRRVLPTRPGVVTEPGLYEMTSWGSPKILPLFRSNADQYSITSIPPSDEGVESWYERSADVFLDIVGRHKTYGRSDLLIIAHGLSHEVLTYQMLWKNGTIPREVQLALGHDEKIQAMCNSSRCGLAPVDSFCGAAMLNLSIDGVLTPLDPTKEDSASTRVPLWLTHRQNVPFVYKPFSDGAKHLARAKSERSTPLNSPIHRKVSSQPGCRGGSISACIGQKSDDGTCVDDGIALAPSSSSAPNTAPFVRHMNTIGQVPTIGRLASKEHMLKGGSFVQPSFVHGSCSFVQPGIALTSECASPMTPGVGFVHGSSQFIYTPTSSVDARSGIHGSFRQAPPVLLGSTPSAFNNSDVRRSTTPLHGRNALLASVPRLMPGSGNDLSGSVWSPAPGRLMHSNDQCRQVTVSQ